jgi:hypothetical protein
MGDLEPALEDAITYMPDNEPSTIAATLRRVIEEGSYERRAERAVEERYGPVAVSTALDSLLERLRPRSTTEATARG